MSLTVSPGFHHADRWTGVAAHTAEYLDNYISNNLEGYQVPRGALKGAEEFLEMVKYGLALDRKEYETEYSSRFPFMAGICGLSIAIGVFEKINPQLATHDTQTELRNIETKVDQYKNHMCKIQKNPSRSISKKNARELLNFFDELMRQGLASQER